MPVKPAEDSQSTTQGWRAWAFPVLLVGGAAVVHFALHVPHGAYVQRTAAAGAKKKKGVHRDRQVYDGEVVSPAFVDQYLPVLESAYEVGFDAANSGAATPEIHSTEFECRTMRCRMRVCGTKPGVNMVLRHVQRVKHGPNQRLWSVFERGKREPQLEGNTVCVDTIVRFAVRDPKIDALR